MQLLELKLDLSQKNWRGILHFEKTDYKTPYKTDLNWPHLENVSRFHEKQ